MTDKADNDALVREALSAVLAAQRVDPYRGWSITELNKAADSARELLGLPSVRDLNPDIAAMQDHASANKATILAALRTPRPEVDGADAQADAELVAAYPELAEHTDDPWFAVGFLREKFERSEAERAIWKERAMTMRIEPTRPQPDETETLRAEVVSDGAVFTIRVELEHDVSAANSTQIHTSVHTKAGANANPMIVMDAAMKALADENAALHQCPAHKAALKGTDHGRG